MGTAQDPVPGNRSRGGRSRALTAASYLMLLVLGVLEGFIGSFQYGRAPTPVIAIVLALLIFVTCLACGWGTGSVTAGLLPAIGWVAMSFILAMPRPNGSVVITATAAGEWYLYGGALASLAGAVSTFFVRIRWTAPPR